MFVCCYAIIGSFGISVCCAVACLEGEKVLATIAGWVNGGSRFRGLCQVVCPLGDTNGVCRSEKIRVAFCL